MFDNQPNPDSPPPQLLNLPENSERVLEADEEIFLLYTRLSSQQAPSSEPLGLGSVDSKLSEIHVSFVIDPPPLELNTSPRSRKHYKAKVKRPEPVTFECILEQDPSSLRSRSGDTGEHKDDNVSGDLPISSLGRRERLMESECLLKEHYFPPPSPLFSPDFLKDAKVLELGAGIGLLACALAPFVHHYTATDIDDIIPLLRKNVIRAAASSDPTVTDLDWVQLHSTPISRRHLIFKPDEYDLIVCCDCIYNSSLVPPLVTTINYCATAQKTIVMVVVELRQEDVLREFLEAWLTSGLWRIWRLPETYLGPRTIGWAGWQGSQDE